MTKSASTKQSKETRIFDHAPEIKNFYFLETGKRGADYRKAIENLCSYVILGKNKHDDVPDGLAQYAKMVESLGAIVIQIGQRPF